MFIARSAARIRFARRAFLLAGLLPCAALVGWALLLRSGSHREAVRREWERCVGLPVGLTAVEHVRPGAVRARGCSLAAFDGRPAFSAPAVEVETSADEVRIRIESLACDESGARLLAGLATEWLGRGARFRRDVVVEIASLSWLVPGVEAAAAPLRIECVIQGDDRAVRLVRTGTGGGADEVRVVRTAAADAPGGATICVDAACAEPVPLAILAAVAADATGIAVGLGGRATVTGTVSATRDATGWSGSARGGVAGVDLESCTAALAGRAVGRADLDIGRVEWQDGRIAACEVECRAAGGRVERRLLDALVNVLGCSQGVAFAGRAGETDRAFDAAGGQLRVDAAGFELRGRPEIGGALAVVDGAAILLPPATPVRAERVAWLLATPDAVYVPSAGAGSWLMSIMPRPDGSGERASRAGPPIPTRGF